MTQSVSPSVGSKAASAGPVDAGHGAQRELGHGHHRAGVAGGQGGVGHAFLHRVDRHAHRGGPGAADRLARLFLGGDEFGGVDDGHAGLQIADGASSSARISFSSPIDEEFERRIAGGGHATAPASMAAGPLSPPMASIAMRGPASIACCPSPASRSGLARDDLAAVIMAAGRAQVVRQLQLAAVRAFLEGRRASAHDGCGACCASRAKFFF